MKVLVVGGSGFIGSRLVGELVARGHQVTNADVAAPSDPSVTHVAVDVRDVGALSVAAQGQDAIVNLAAMHRDDVRPLSLYDEVNVQGARNVVAAAEHNSVTRILFTSSVAVYGLGKQNPNEQSTPEPFNEYGVTKLAAEGVYRQWAGDGRFLTIVRPSVVFGERNRGNVWTLANQLSTGRFVMIGSGENVKSMSYVGNVVAFLADALDDPTPLRLVNYADKPDLTTRELVTELRELLGKGGGTGPRLPLGLGLVAGRLLDAVAKATGRSFPISEVRIQKFVSETTVDTALLDSTGYERRFTLREALKRTIAADFPRS